MRRRPILGVVLPLVAAAVLLTGCANASESEPTAAAEEASEVLTPENLGKTNQTVEHDPAVTPENSDELLASLQIDSALTVEEKAAAFMDLYTRWNMAGATPETVLAERANALDGAEPQNEEFTAEVAQQNKETFATAMYGENWTQFTDEVNKLVEANGTGVYRYMVTFGSEQLPNTNSKNREAFTESFAENVQVTEWANATEKSHPSLWPLVERAKKTFGTEEVLIINLIATRSNNAEQNMFSENATYADANGAQMFVHVVLTPENGHDIARYVQIDDHDFGNAVSYEASVR